MIPDSSKLEMLLAELGQLCYDRGWVFGTSGNFSAVVNHDPFCMTITATGLDKASLSSAQFVHVDGDGTVTDGSGLPSAETALHLTAVRLRKAGAVLHTHSVWSTMISDLYGTRGGLYLEGYEMLKGLHGVNSHTHREWLPILENNQNMAQLSGAVEDILTEYPEAHGFLLRGHGLYTWGKDLAEAKRHLEVLEFLLEVTGRVGCAHRVP